MIRLGSSFRVRTPEETFAIASTYISRFQISRITESTRLDRIGIPVFAGIRPGAQRGSMIVTAGKGLTTTEARTGALMEAIELAFSEPKNSCLKYTFSKPTEILQIPGRKCDILDLCPIIDTEIPADEPIPCVTAFDILNNVDVLVPAELVFVPTPADWPRFFGYHTNGLASGNTREEAVLHALLEVVERDVLSFDHVYDSSRYVPLTRLPKALGEMHQQLENKGLRLVLRTTLNTFELPFFKAYLIEPGEFNPVYLSAGYGCHIDPVIAAVRAITEAVQSRMSHIHGGREDLARHVQMYEELNFRERSRIVQESFEGIADQRNAIAFAEIPYPQVAQDSVAASLQGILEHLEENASVQSVLCAFHTEEDEPLQVVKVITPGLEFYNADANRMGRRLHDFIQQVVDDHLRWAEP